MQSIKFPAGVVSYQETNIAFQSCFHMLGHSSSVRFGSLDGPGDLLPKLDASIGSGEDGFGGEDFLRFDPTNHKLVGAFFDIPLKHMHIAGFPNYLMHKVADPKYVDIRLLSDVLSVPKCRFATLDTRLKVILCSTHEGFVPNGQTQFISMSQGLHLLVENGHYMGFFVHDPLSCLSGGDATLQVDYDILQALYWPHRDTVFEYGFDDNNEAFKDYFRGLQASLVSYLAGVRPVQNAICNAIQDALHD